MERDIKGNWEWHDLCKNYNKNTPFQEPDNIMIQRQETSKTQKLKMFLQP